MAQKFLTNIDVSGKVVIDGSIFTNGSTVLDVQGSQGQLFSVTNSLTGDLFSVSDISGVPIFNVNSSGAVDIDGALTINGGDVKIVKQNDAPILTLLHDGTNTVANDLLFRMQFQSDFNGTHQNWGKIELDTNNSAVRTNMDFYVKSASGNEQLALRLEGQSSDVPNAIFAGNVTIGSVDASVGEGLNIGNASPTIQLFDTTNDAKLLLYTQDSNSVIGTYSNHSLFLYTNSTEALEIDNSQNATFAGNIVMTANATVDGVDISALPTTFAPTNAEQNVQSDWNATSGDAQILNKLNREFKTDYWGDDRFVRVVGGSGADTGDKWVHISSVDIGSGYEKVKIQFTIGSYDDNARGDERINVLYENHNSAQEGHILHWYKGDQIPTLFKAVKSIRSASSGLANTYDLYVQIDGAWKDSFTVHAEWWKTHTDDSTITYPTTAGGSTPTAGSDDKSLTSRERWIDADKLDGQHGSYYAPAATTLAGYGITDGLVIGTTSTTAMAGNTTIPTVPSSYAPTDAEANVQADWTETTTTSDAFILNKPTTFAPTAHNHSADQITSGTLSTDRIPEFVPKYTYQTGTSGVFMPMVKGGINTGNAGTTTGRLRIRLPHYKEAIMQSFVVDVYEYNTNRFQSYKVGGYSYNDSNATWYNTSAIAIMDSDNRDLTVRFGSYETAGFQCVSIGEVDTVWSYPQVVVRDYLGGHSAALADFQDSFVVEFITTDLVSYDHEHDNNQPFADYNRLDNTPTTLSGYGITDSLVIGTTSTTAMAGNTSLLAIGTTSTTAMAGDTAIPTDHAGLYLPIGGGILTGDLKINTQIGFQRDGANYSNYIKSTQYVSEGYDDSGTPPDDRYWLEYGAKGGHHFVVNTDGGTGSAENAYDDFTIWQGEVDGDRLFEVTNAGNTSITGGVKVFGSIESRKNIVSNSNYNIAQISSTRTVNDYGGLNKTYAKLDIQTPGTATDGGSSAHGLAHLSIKLADNAGNTDLVQKALLRHDSELILGGFYPQTTETELAGLTIRSRYAGSNRNFLRFQTDHSSATTEWTMAKIYAGDGGNFNGKMFFQVATGSNASTSYSTGHDAQLETAMFIDDTKEVTFNSNIKLAGANPYIIGGGSGAMRIKHTSGQTMYLRPDETGSLSIFEGANSQSVYFMTQTPSVNDTTSESAQLKFHTRSKQSDGTAVSKYATIKHRTHSIGYNYTTLDFSGSDKSKFNMPIEAAGGLYYTGDAHMGFVPHPIGAQYRSDSSADTGYILIKLPTAVGATPDDMVSFHVDVYDYTSNEMISVFIGGYIYTSTATSSSYWYNCTAIINAKQTTKDFNVRFGYDGTNFYAAIGETNSVWSHPSIVLRDFQCSFRGNVEHYIDGWAISTETTALTGVDETQTGNFPQAKHAATATTATTATTASSVPYSGLTGTVPTWNQNTTGSAGSVAWGNITSKPYIETNGTTSATATTAIASVAHATYTAAFFDFVIKNGTNVRAGTVAACHDGTNVEFTETSTVDLGDTSDVTLNVVISTSYLQLQATTTSSTWTIKSLIRAI